MNMLLTVFYSKQNAVIHTTFTLWLVFSFSSIQGICIMYTKRKSKLKTKPKRCLKNSVIRLLFSIPFFLVLILLRPHHHHTESKLIACFLSIISCDWLPAKVNLKEHSILTWRSVRNHLQNQGCLLICTFFWGILLPCQIKQISIKYWLIIYLMLWILYV